MKAQVYYGVFAILVGSTAGELTIIGVPMPQALMITLVLGLAGLKAALIALFYQHLKYEPRALSSFLILALLGAVTLITLSLLSIQGMHTHG